MQTSGGNVEERIEHIVSWIKNFFDGTNCNAIVGISGGKDSATVAALCVKALGKERVIGVLMPNGEQSDIEDAKEIVAKLGIKSQVINIQEIYYAYDKLNILSTQQARINTPARIRMAVLYAIAANENGRVANTCNLSEDYVGYATKYGDGAGDFSPLAEYTVAEVYEMARMLDLPEVIFKKAPADGLSGKTDEDNLGFTYDVLDKYIRTGVCEDTAIKEKIDNLHRNNLHKLELMPHCSYL